MADLKPLGSEKLKGVNQIKRILEIASYKETPKVETNLLETVNYTIKLSDGNHYGIVKEKSGYIIKSGINESNLDYNDPIRHRKYYRSYSEAMKRLNIMVAEVNRSSGFDEETPLIGESLKKKFLNEKKYVLKQDKPATDTTTPPPADAVPPPAPATGESTPPTGAVPPPPAEGATPPTDDLGLGMDSSLPPAEEGSTPPPAEGDMGGDDLDMGGDDLDMGGDNPTPTDTGMNDMGGEDLDMGDEEPSDTGMEDMGGDEDAADEGNGGPSSLKTIQKLTGRLSQKIRSFDKEKGLDSQDIKYVVNSIISAIDLSKLDDDDRDDILDKLEEYDEYDMGDEGDLDLSGDDDLDMEDDLGGEDDLDMGDDLGMDTPTPDSDLAATPPPAPEEPALKTESRVEKVLSSYFDIRPEEKPILEEKNKKNFLKEKLKKIQVKNEIENLSETTKQFLTANFLINENKNIKFIGKTNKDNLIFNQNGKQIKVTKDGRII